MAASTDRGNERAGGGGEAEEEVKTDGWLTTYADMVTLLLTFFVLMVALSNTDTEKMEMFMVALSRDGLDPETFYEIQERFRDWTEDADAWDEEFPHPETGSEVDDDRGGKDALADLAEAMEGYIADEQLGDVIMLEFNGEFLLLTLASDILFETGMAALTPEMHESAAYLASLLGATFNPDDPFEIVVAGHTDDRPINTPQYPSNWHLSRDRAINYLYELVTISDLDPSFFYARACGEYRPIATNSTPEGRQLNRRVEVMVSLARDNPLWDRGSQMEEEPPAPATQEQTEQPSDALPGEPYDAPIDERTVE